MNKEKNKPLHEKLDDQQTFNRNIVKRIQELEDRRPSKLNDQVDIKLMKQEEFNEKVLIRLDQEIENRTKAFELIEELKEELRLLEQYTVKGLTDNLRDLQYNLETKLERIDDILVVHRNQSDNQRKNHFQLQKVFSDKVMELLEGTHGKQK